MSVHIRRILRNFSYITTSTSYGTVYSVSAMDMFGASADLPYASKVVFYGNIWVVNCAGSTGGGGYRLPISGYREASSTSMVVTNGGSQEVLGTAGNQVAISGGSSMTITAKGLYSNVTNVILLTLDIKVVGYQAE